MNTFLIYNSYISEYYIIGRQLSFLMACLIFLQLINESFEELRKAFVFRSVFYVFDAIIKKNKCVVIVSQTACASSILYFSC